MPSLKKLAVPAIAVASLAMSAAALYLQLDTQRILHARGLVVSDAHGVKRVIIGAPLPDPLTRGKPGAKRTGVLSGILIDGPDGSERGGYGTTDAGGEALLTLDSDIGLEQFKVVANPRQGATLVLATGDGQRALMLTTYTGTPQILQLHGHTRTGTYRPTRPAR